MHFYFSVKSRIVCIINFGLCYHNDYEDKSAGGTYEAFKTSANFDIFKFPLLNFEAFYASLRLVHTQASNYLAR